MATLETYPSVIAWWGAGLSTLLAAVKLFELWQARFRVDVSYNFRGNENLGNDIYIRNLSNRPLILEHWQLLYCSGYWPLRQYEPFYRADPDTGDSKLEPYDTHSLNFKDENYFSWGHQSLKGRRIFIRLHIAGRKPFLKFVYSP